MIVYKAVNKVNGKIYVGQTRHTLEYRKSVHLKKAREGVNTHFYAALRKYGEDAFEWSVICTASSKDDLNILETYYIQKFNTVKCGYNMVDGGENNIMDIKSVYEHHHDIVLSKENREKISSGMKKRIADGKFFTEEHRKHLSEAAKGNHNFGTGDTRSVACYCVEEDGTEHHFHNIKQGGEWWYKQYAPFPYSACVYRRKIRQSIQCGYCEYGRTHLRVEYPKWYEEVVE